MIYSKNILKWKRLQWRNSTSFVRIWDLFVTEPIFDHKVPLSVSHPSVVLLSPVLAEMPVQVLAVNVGSLTRKSQPTGGALGAIIEGADHTIMPPKNSNDTRLKRDAGKWGSSTVTYLWIATLLSCNYFTPEQRQSVLVHLIFTVIYRFKSSEIEFVFYKSNQQSKVELQSSTADVQVPKQSSSMPTQLCTSFRKTQCDCLDG